MFERSRADGIIVIGDIEGGDPALDILAAQYRFVVGVTDRTTRRQIPGVSADSGAAAGVRPIWRPLALLTRLPARLSSRDPRKAPRRRSAVAGQHGKRDRAEPGR
jgi:hypothetical protein